MLHRPTSVLEQIQCASEEEARRLETDTYYRMKELYGADKVRGAGNTSSVDVVYEESETDESIDEEEYSSDQTEEDEYSDEYEY